MSHHAARIAPSATVLPTAYGTLLDIGTRQFALDGPDWAVFTAKILPLLDGSRDVASIVAATPEFLAESVTAFLERLESLGIVQRCSPIQPVALRNKAVALFGDESFSRRLERAIEQCDPQIRIYRSDPGADAALAAEASFRIFTFGETVDIDSTEFAREMLEKPTLYVWQNIEEVFCFLEDRAKVGPCWRCAFWRSLATEATRLESFESSDANSKNILDCIARYASLALGGAAEALPWNRLAIHMAGTVFGHLVSPMPWCARCDHSHYASPLVEQRSPMYLDDADPRAAVYKWVDSRTGIILSIVASDKETEEIPSISSAVVVMAPFLNQSGLRYPSVCGAGKGYSEHTALIGAIGEGVSDIRPAVPIRDGCCTPPPRLSTMISLPPSGWSYTSKHSTTLPHFDFVRIGPIGRSIGCVAYGSIRARLFGSPPCRLFCTFRWNQSTTTCR